MEESHHTTIQQRLNALSEEQLNETVKAIAGQVRNRTLTLPLKDYIELVESTAKAIVYPDKASIPPNLASTLTRLNINQDNWLNQLQAYGSHFYRMVGALENFKAKTLQLKQQWLKGIRHIEKLYLSSS